MHRRHAVIPIGTAAQQDLDFMLTLAPPAGYLCGVTRLVL
jgi:hypothetical protein